MADISAGLLMYRKTRGYLEVLLVHPGGPLWSGKDLGVWSIPKGIIDKDEEPLSAAIREFEEETGLKAKGEFIPLKPVRLKSGKLVMAWAFEGDCDPCEINSNTFSMEWPPRSGRIQDFPEIDKASWFGIGEAKRMINLGQIGLLEEMERLISD